MENVELIGQKWAGAIRCLIHYPYSVTLHQIRSFRPSLTLAVTARTIGEQRGIYQLCTVQQANVSSGHWKSSPSVSGDSR